MQPNPTEWPIETQLRYHDCKHYDSCLTIAANGDWIGFTCDECPVWFEAKREVKALLSLDAKENGSHICPHCNTNLKRILGSWKNLPKTYYCTGCARVIQKEEASDEKQESEEA